MESGMYGDNEIVPEWCDYCGTPLIDEEGLHHTRGGVRLVFCSRECRGLFHQHESATI